MKAEINLDWLDAEIDLLFEKGAKSEMSSVYDDIRFDTLIEVRSKCEPIKEPYPSLIIKDDGTSNYNLDSTAVVTFKTDARESEPVFDFINDDAVFPVNISFTTEGCTFLSKACIEIWEEGFVCHNSNKCELCKNKQ